LIELCRQFGNLFEDFPVKHAGVLRSQPCAYGAHQRCHVSQLASHGDQRKIACRVPGWTSALAVTKALGIGRVSAY